MLAHSWGSLCCCGFSAALVHSGAPPAFSLHSCDVSSGMCLERLESLTPSKNRMEKKGTPRVARRLLASQLLGGAGSSSNDSMRQLIALARACGLMRHLPMAKPRRMPMDGERIREAMGGPARVRPGVPMTHTMASEARGSGTAYEHGHGGASRLSKRHLSLKRPERGGARYRTATVESSYYAVLLISLGSLGILAAECRNRIVHGRSMQSSSITKSVRAQKSV